MAAVDTELVTEKGNDRLPLILFAIAVAVQLVVSFVLPIMMAEDSPGYLHLAIGGLFNPDVAPQRTLGYPVLLYLFGVDWTDSIVPAAIGQQIMACLMPVLVYLTCRGANRPLAFLAGLATIAYLYFHAVAVIMMTDLAFPFFVVFVCYAVVAYNAKPDWFRLLAVVFLLFFATEIRPNGAGGYVAMAAIVGLAALWDLWKKAGYRRFAHLALVLVVGLFHVVGKSHVSERTSTHLTPFFIWHWAYDDELWRRAAMDALAIPAPRYLAPFVALENGERTRELFDAFKEAVAMNPDLRRRFLSEIDERGAVLDIKSQYRDIALTDTDAIMQIALTDRNTHNGANMVMEMWKLLGKDRTTRLLNGALLETFIARPDVAWLRLKFVADRIQNGIFYSRMMVGQWVHVPTPDTPGKMAPFLHLPKSFLAEWVYGMDLRTGLGKRHYVTSQPLNLNDALHVLKEKENYLAFGNYWLGLSTTHIHKTVIFLTILTLIFVPWSANKGAWLFAFSMGAIFPLLALYLSNLDFRNLMAGFPMMAIALVFAFEGMFRLATIGLVRARRPGPKIA